jgi:hypothetical protein
MVSEEQRATCNRFGAEPLEAPSDLKVGIARNALTGPWPINGLRHPPAGDTTGWYLWTGEELSADPDFFVPLHVQHLEAARPEVVKYLALPPGWRFLIADGYEDVWYDPNLLAID